MPARPAGFCEIGLGDLTVTFVPDGFLCSTPASTYPGTPETLWEANGHLLDEAGRVVMSLGTLLVRTGGKLVLIDLGWGPGSASLGSSASGSSNGRIAGGAMLDNLAKLGIGPTEVDAVIFSHLHRDHTGWIVDPSSADGDSSELAPAFPNAVHYLSEAEWSYWSGAGRAPAGPAPTDDQLAVLAARLDFLADGDRPMPGIEVMATPGHTPGHLSLVLFSGNERAVVLGDAVHCPIELLEPELSFIADVDPTLAKRTRLHVEQELLRPGTLAAGPHFADLVFGRLMAGRGRPSWSFPDTQRRSPGDPF